MYHNTHLYRVAKENNFFLPKYHTLIPVCPPLLANEMKKFETMPIWCPSEVHYERALQTVEQVWYPHIKHSKIRSFEEAVSIAELGTAPGYLAELKGFTTKRDYIQKNYEEIRKTVSLIMDGELFDFKDVAKFGPKVEVRSKEKLLQEDLELNKQRTFCIMGMVFYIVGLMLYSDQNERFCEPNSKGSNRSYWSLIGFNPYYGGFNNLAATMQRNGGKNFFCLDIKGQEASITPKLQIDIYRKIRNPYLKSEPESHPVEELYPRNDVELENLKDWYLKELVFTTSVDVRGWVGTMLGMNPSGGNNTLQDNQLAQEVSGCYHLACVTDHEVPRLVQLYFYLSVKMMADDSIFEDHPLWKGVEESYLHLNFRTTNECGPTGTTVPITGAKIMNCMFAWVSNRQMYVAMPNFDKLIAGIFYYRKSNSWRLTYAKLCAIRTLVFPFKRYLHEVEHYITYIEQEHWLEMQHSEKWLDEKLPFHTLERLKLSIRDLEFLHYAQEISGGHNNIPEINALIRVSLSSDTHDYWQEKEFC